MMATMMATMVSPMAWGDVGDAGPGVSRGRDDPVRRPRPTDHLLVGRKAERALLDAERAAVRAGALRTVMLAGEAGIGKTTLMAAFTESIATHAVPTFIGRCADGASVPLQPFRDIVASMIDRAPLELLADHVKACGGELRRIAPQLGWRVPTAPSPSSSDDATERHMLFNAIADLVRRLAAGDHLVLVLDDLHWAEPTALLLTRHLIRALNNCPVLVVLSFRDTDLDHNRELRRTIADLERGTCCRIHLSGLDPGEMGELVTAMAPGFARAAPSLISTLVEETSGNPLYTSQLVRHLLESDLLAVESDMVHFRAPVDQLPVPPGLRDVVWSRVESLGPIATEVLVAASVLGLEVDRDLLVEIVDVGEGEVDDALDDALRAGLLEGDSQRPTVVRFTHGLVVHALIGEPAPLRLRRLHERTAEALEKREDEHPHRTVIDLAHHWTAAGNRVRAQRWAVAAGDHDFAHLAPAEAARWYAIAIEHARAVGVSEGEESALLLRLGRAQVRAGDASARSTLLDAARLAKSGGATDVLVGAALAGDRNLVSGSADPELLAVIESALDALEPVGDSDAVTRCRLLAQLGRELVYTRRSDERYAVASTALDLALKQDDPTLLPSIVGSLLEALWAPGASALRREIAERAVADVERVGDPVLEFRARHAVYNVAIELADAEAAQRNIERLRAIANEIGEPRMRWVISLIDTFETMMRGDLDESERLSGVMFELGSQLGYSDAFLLYAAQILVNRTFSGRHAEVLPMVEQALETNRSALLFRLMRAILCQATGRIDVAREMLDQGVADRFEHLPIDSLWKTAILGYAVLAVEMEDVPAATQLLPILEPLAAEISFSGATSQGCIGAYVGNLASILGQHELAETHLNAALEVAASFGWTYHRARGLLALAQSRRRRDGCYDDVAYGWLAEALELGRAHGLHGVVHIADAALASRP